MRNRRLGLRWRSTIAFAGGALVLSIALASITYALATAYLIPQRERTAMQQASLHAALARDFLLGDPAPPSEVLETLAGQTESDVVLLVDGRWFSSSVTVDERRLPSAVLAAVDGGVAARQRFDLNGRPALVVGFPLPSSGSQYFEVFPLVELERTLRTLGVVLAIAATATTSAGVGVGVWASRRVMRPLRDVSSASVNIASGDLNTRLPERDDPDLMPLVDSFNEMATALQRRIEREQRFASDVSHELRTPLTALGNAVQVILAREHELPERCRNAVAILAAQVDYFQQLVLDLLEISRLDAGVERVEETPVHLPDLVQRVVDTHGSRRVEVVAHDVDEPILTDARRVERILANLVDNAEKHAHGVTAVTIDHDGGDIRIAVDDDGPGIAPQSRTEVFERFRRGPRAGAGAKGTGLGLALVAQHAVLLGGRVEVRASPAGGARFVVHLPDRRAC